MKNGCGTKNGRNGVASLLVVVLILIIFGGFWLYMTDRTLLVDLVNGRNYNPSTEDAVVMANLRLTNKANRILKASNPSFQQADEFNQNCPNAVDSTSTLGCYSAGGIYVYAIENNELDGIREAVLAHELLHAVWERLNPWDRKSLYADLDKVYQENLETLGSHMSLYSSDAYYDELHSIIGTQIPNSQLTDALRSHYAKYFNNQNKVYEYFESYNAKFLENEAKIAELSEKITDLTMKLNQRISAYNDAFSILNDEISAFNSRSAAGYYGDYQSFSADRANLIRQQNTLQQQYSSISESIEEINKLIEEYNSQVYEAGEMFDSINSNAMSSGSGVINQ